MLTSKLSAFVLEADWELILRFQEFQWFPSEPIFACSLKFSLDRSLEFQFRLIGLLFVRFNISIVKWTESPFQIKLISCFKYCTRIISVLNLVEVIVRLFLRPSRYRKTRSPRIDWLYRQEITAWLLFLITLLQFY